MDATGVVAGTLVKTAYGYVPIEHITVGTLVVTDDSAGGHTLRAVTGAACHKELCFLSVTVGSEILGVSPTHVCAVSDDKMWCCACELHPHQLLQTASGSCGVTDIQGVAEPVVLYDITVEESHTFYITHEDIRVHNEIVAAIGFTLVHSGFFADLTVKSITCALACGAFLVGCVRDAMGRHAVTAGTREKQHVVCAQQGFGEDVHYPDPHADALIQRQHEAEALRKFQDAIAHNAPSSIQQAVQSSQQTSIASNFLDESTKSENSNSSVIQDVITIEQLIQKAESDGDDLRTKLLQVQSQITLEDMCNDYIVQSTNSTITNHTLSAYNMSPDICAALAVVHNQCPDVHVSFSNKSSCISEQLFVFPCTP